MSGVRLARAAVALTVAIGLVAALPLGLAPRALAHASQTDAVPAAGAVLDTMPSEVVVTFDSPLMAVGAALVVRDSGGADVTAAAPIVDANTITVALRPDVDPGTFTVAYRVVSSDGHPITGNYAFSVAAQSVAGAGAAPPPGVPLTTSVSSSPAVLVVVAAAVVAGAVAVGLAVVRRSRSEREG